MVVLICVFRESEALVVVTLGPTLSVQNLQLWLVQMQWPAMKLLKKSGPSLRRRICM